MKSKKKKALHKKAYSRRETITLVSQPGRELDPFPVLYAQVFLPLHVQFMYHENDDHRNDTCSELEYRWLP